MNKHYCTHGTLLSSYCHECTTPEPTTAELIAYVRKWNFGQKTLLIADRLEEAEKSIEELAQDELAQEIRAEQAEAQLEAVRGLRRHKATAINTGRGGSALMVTEDKSGRFVYFNALDKALEKQE